VKIRSVVVTQSC